MVKMRLIIPLIALFLVNFAVERGVCQSLRPPAEEASGRAAENSAGFYLTASCLSIINQAFHASDLALQKRFRPGSHLSQPLEVNIN
jgi:hypothetical protein